MFRYDEAACVSEETYQERIARAEPAYGDLLYSREGTYFGIAAEVPKGIPVCLGQRMVLIRPIKSEINPSFLRLWLNSDIMVRHITGFRDGTVAERLNMPTIRGLPVPIFTLSEQDEIASLLSALDDKIELNRQTNETLEALARAFLKDWFVDFGPTRAKAEGRAPYLAPELWDLFPDALDDDDKPVGWRKSKLDDLFAVSIGRTPPRKETHHFVPGGDGKTWLSIKTMGELQTYAITSDEDLTPQAVASFRIPLIPSGTVIVSFKLTVGRVAIAAKDMYSNEAIAHLVSKQGTPVSNFYAYCFMKGFDYETLGSTSSIATAVNSKSIKGIEMLVPDAKSHDAFQEVVKPIFDRILSNVFETETIAQTRDLLLPRLMSGEVRLREAEKIVEAVA